MVVVTMVVAMVVIAAAICNTEPPAPDKHSFCPAPVVPHNTHYSCATSSSIDRALTLSVSTCSNIHRALTLTVSTCSNIHRALTLTVSTCSSSWLRRASASPNCPAPMRTDANWVYCSTLPACHESLSAMTNSTWP